MGWAYHISRGLFFHPWFSFFLFQLKFNVAGSFSRSAVNYNAGGRTVVSNIVMATTVLITLLFLMPLFHYTPNLILAAIIITAVIGLIDYQAAFRLWKVDKLDCIACLSSFFGVLFISVPIGLAIAVCSFSAINLNPWMAGCLNVLTSLHLMYYNFSS